METQGDCVQLYSKIVVKCKFYGCVEIVFIWYFTGSVGWKHYDLFPIP